MNNEIKEILDRLERIDHKEYSCDFEFADSATFDEMARCFEERKKMADYITNLQQIEQEHQRINGELRKENERLKEALNCKEYFSSTMPEDTEFVILTKNNYDRQQKDIQLELIDYKSRCEKASAELKNWEKLDLDNLLVAIRRTQNILQNGSEKDER